MEETTNKTCSIILNANEESKNARVKTKRSTVGDYTVIKDSVCGIKKSKTTVIVSNKTNFKALLTKCESLLNNDAEEICIYGLGAAVNKTCNLALQLQENHKNTLELDIVTSTVKLYDNLIPNSDNGDFSIRERLNSAITIRVIRKIPITSLKFKKP